MTFHAPEPPKHPWVYDKFGFGLDSEYMYYRPYREVKVGMFLACTRIGWEHEDVYRVTAVTPDSWVGDCVMSELPEEVGSEVTVWAGAYKEFHVKHGVIK